MCVEVGVKVEVAVDVGVFVAVDVLVGEGVAEVVRDGVAVIESVGEAEGVAVFVKVGVVVKVGVFTRVIVPVFVGVKVGGQGVPLARKQGVLVGWGGTDFKVGAVGSLLPQEQPSGIEARAIRRRMITVRFTKHPLEEFVK